MTFWSVCYALGGKNQQLSQWKSLQSPRSFHIVPQRDKKNAHNFVFFLLMSRLLFTENLFLPAARWIMTFTMTFWGTWDKTCNEKYRNCAATTNGCRAMKHRPPPPSRLPSRQSSFSQKIMWQSLQTLPPCGFRFSLTRWCCSYTTDETHMESKVVVGNLQDKGPPLCLCGAEAALGLVYMFPSQLFWRGWWPNSNKVSLQFF